MTPTIPIANSLEALNLSADVRNSDIPPVRRDAEELAIRQATGRSHIVADAEQTHGVDALTQALSDGILLQSQSSIAAQFASEKCTSRKVEVENENHAKASADGRNLALVHKLEEMSVELQTFCDKNKKFTGECIEMCKGEAVNENHAQVSTDGQNLALVRKVKKMSVELQTFCDKNKKLIGECIEEHKKTRHTEKREKLRKSGVEVPVKNKHFLCDHRTAVVLIGTMFLTVIVLSLIFREKIFGFISKINGPMYGPQPDWSSWESIDGPEQGPAFRPPECRFPPLYNTNWAELMECRRAMFSCPGGCNLHLLN